jgi:DNA polymerase V
MGISVVVWQVAAGFPSPAEEFLERPLDLSDLLVSDAAATYAVRVRGDSMIGDGIMDGDIAVVDKGLEAAHNDIIIARLNDTFTIKRLALRQGTTWLLPSNPRYEPIAVTHEIDFEVWGVVRGIVRVLVDRDL